MFKWKVSGLGGGSSKKAQKGQAASEKLNNSNVSNNANNTDNNNEDNNKNNKNNKERSKSPNKKDAETANNTSSSNNQQQQQQTSAAPMPNSPQKPGGFRLFQSSNNSSNNSGNNQPPQSSTSNAQPNGILKNSYDRDAMSRVGQRLAMTNAPPPPMIPNGPTSPNSNNTTMSSDNVFLPPNVTPTKAGWRPNKADPSTTVAGGAPSEEAIPSDSLYNGGGQPGSSESWMRSSIQDQNKQQQFGSRPSLNGMAHWSSHGYLAKGSPNENPIPTSPKPGEGYVVLKRQGEHMITTLNQPQSLPINAVPSTSQQQQQRFPAPLQMNTNDNPGDRKYYSVKGYGDMRSKHNTTTNNGNVSNLPNGINPMDHHQMDPKYFSVDARYHSMKNLPPEIRAKLRENLQQNITSINTNPYQPPPMGQFQHPTMAPVPPPRTTNEQQQQMKPSRPVVPAKPQQTEMTSKSGGGGGNSVSWHEWTQQLQAYIAWVNSQLRKRPELKAVQDLRTDLQSGEVLAQLIEIISGEKIAGIQYAPESLQGMRENIERILQFMAAKRIRMHQITSKEVLEGNLKAVMRLILALAAHYKPQSVRHHDVGYDKIDTTTNSNTTSGSGPNSVSNNTDSNPNTKNHPPPVSVEETTLNQTHDSVLGHNTTNDSNGSMNNVVKRSPSMNDNHYISKSSKSRLINEANQIYENFSSSRQQAAQQQQQQSTRFSTKATIETKPSTQTLSSSSNIVQEVVPTQLDNSNITTNNNVNKNNNKNNNSKPEMQREGSFVMSQSREGSFVRTGSGRKLPKIPPYHQKESSKNVSELLNTSLPSTPLKLDTTQEDLDVDNKMENRKSKPKALEFWESMTETVDRTDFRYNTIHRMSVGRRMLPKAPGANTELARSHSLDRGAGSLNSSFSGEHEPVAAARPKHRMDSESSAPSSPPPNPGTNQSKIPPDGCSLQSHGSSGAAQPGQPSPPSSDSRGEVEGSSDNNSPPTSVIQGKSNNPQTDLWDQQRKNPAYDWLRGAFNGKVDEETLLTQLRQHRLGDGHSGSDSKHSDTMSDQGNIPYDVLLQDLTQAKRQLLELHNLLMTNLSATCDGKNPSPSSDEFAQCVENISVLNLRLKNADERCQLLKADLRQAKQECATLEGSKNGLQSRLTEQELATSQLKQDLVRVTLAKQTLEYEKKELLRRVDELERGLAGVKNENGEKEKHIKAYKQQLEDAIRKQRDFHIAASAAGLTPNGDPDLKALYDEELAVAKDAIGNLRSTFGGSDPNQHILDTLEQCISVIIEKLHRLDQDKNGSRLSSMDLDKSIEGPTGPPTTKILYFTNRSVTPFMSSINKKIGEITLRDFKVLFDRPGFYRFHFKSVDQEFGMVKEEISSDDNVLPGADGKIVAWVEED